jgi:hypothetical protein
VDVVLCARARAGVLFRCCCYYLLSPLLFKDSWSASLILLCVLRTSCGLLVVIIAFGSPLSSLHEAL